MYSINGIFVRSSDPILKAKLIVKNDLSNPPNLKKLSELVGVPDTNVLKFELLKALINIYDKNGFTDLLKVPTSCSKGFLASIKKVFLLLINLFHFVGTI